MSEYRAKPEAIRYWQKLTAHDRIDFTHRFTQGDPSWREGLSADEQYHTLAGSAFLASPEQVALSRAARRAERESEHQRELAAWSRGCCFVNGREVPVEFCPDFIVRHHQELAEKGKA